MNWNKTAQVESRVYKRNKNTPDIISYVLTDTHLRFLASQNLKELIIPMFSRERD